MTLEECRKQIDETDKEITKLFCKRMEISKNVALYKKENGMKVFDSERERALLDKIEENAGAYGNSARRLYGTMLELSRAYQQSIIAPQSAISKTVQNAIAATPDLFPEKAVTACQGIEGAYSSRACEKLFAKPSIMYFTGFEAVFKAVEKELCEFGIVPLENSSAGSVNEIYNLMDKYKFSIVRSTKIHIVHSLLTKENIKKEDIRTIYSHPQAISQCSEFISSLKNVAVVPCENTAIAAQRAAKEGGTTAAIASPECENQYGLVTVQRAVQNFSNNYTRFICFSKTVRIYPGADRTSLLIKTPNRPGALYDVMAKFNALGINIIKLESRPMPDTDFEFMFYFDIDASVYSDKILKITGELENSLGSENVKYLGSYREV